MNGITGIQYYKIMHRFYEIDETELRKNLDLNIRFIFQNYVKGKNYN